MNNCMLAKLSDVSVITGWSCRQSRSRDDDEDDGDDVGDDAEPQSDVVQEPRHLRVSHRQISVARQVGVSGLEERKHHVCDRIQNLLMKQLFFYEINAWKKQQWKTFIWIVFEVIVNRVFPLLFTVNTGKAV